MVRERAQGEDLAYGAPVLPDEFEPCTDSHLAEIDSAERQSGEHVEQFRNEPHVPHASDAPEDS